MASGYSQDVARHVSRKAVGGAAGGTAGTTGKAEGEEGVLVRAAAARNAPRNRDAMRKNRFAGMANCSLLYIGRVLVAKGPGFLEQEAGRSNGEDSLFIATRHDVRFDDYNFHKRFMYVAILMQPLRWLFLRPMQINLEAVQIFLRPVQFFRRAGGLFPIGGVAVSA